LRTIDAYARSLDPRVTQVNVSLACQHESILVAASDGTRAGDVRPLMRLDVRVIAEEGERRESGNAGGGGRYALDELMQPEAWQRLADEAVRQATPEPRGRGRAGRVHDGGPRPGLARACCCTRPSVTDSKAISIARASRPSTARWASGWRPSTAPWSMTATLPGRRGSLSIDDEGTPTHCTTLIEDGRLVGLMQDKLNARAMGMPTTGNGRRESFAHLPMPRMTNTYMRPGEHDPGEILASVDDGIYAVNFNGGQVDITSGKFVFVASEAYRVKNGKLGAPLKGATLIGNGPDVLTRVAMVGNDLELDAGVGVCGKDGQGVPVGVGQPTLRIDGLTVGGTA
jgi:TldD protein